MPDEGLACTGYASCDAQHRGRWICSHAGESLPSSLPVGVDPEPLTVHLVMHVVYSREGQDLSVLQISELLRRHGPGAARDSHVTRTLTIRVHAVSVSSQGVIRGSVRRASCCDVDSPHIIMHPETNGGFSYTA